MSGSGSPPTSSKAARRKIEIGPYLELDGRARKVTAIGTMGAPHRFTELVRSPCAHPAQPKGRLSREHDGMQATGWYSLSA